MIPFLRGNSYARGNICKFSAAKYALFAGTGAHGLGLHMDWGYMGSNQKLLIAWLKNKNNPPLAHLYVHACATLAEQPIACHSKWPVTGRA